MPKSIRLPPPETFSMTRSGEPLAQRRQQRVQPLDVLEVAVLVAVTVAVPVAVDPQVVVPLEVVGTVLVDELHEAVVAPTGALRRRRGRFAPPSCSPAAQVRDRSGRRACASQRSLIPNFAVDRLARSTRSGSTQMPNFMPRVRASSPSTARPFGKPFLVHGPGPETRREVPELVVSRVPAGIEDEQLRAQRGIARESPAAPRLR